MCSYLAQHAELRGRQSRHGLLQLGPHRHVRLGDEEKTAAEKCEEEWEIRCSQLQEGVKEVWVKRSRRLL